MKGRILALDYGKKRCGIAVTDELQLIASPLTTVETKLLSVFLTNYLQTENVVLFIVGEPTQRDGSPSEISSAINQFILTFQKAFPTLVIKRIDERFTSKLAFQTMIESGIGKQKRQDKSTVDKIAAAIMLQDYLRYNL